MEAVRRLPEDTQDDIARTILQLAGSEIAAEPVDVAVGPAERGDLVGAEAAYRRGQASGALTLGALLEKKGDVAGAESAYRRADDLGAVQP